MVCCYTELLGSSGGGFKENLPVVLSLGDELDQGTVPALARGTEPQAWAPELPRAWGQGWALLREHPLPLLSPPLRVLLSLAALCCHV